MPHLEATEYRYGQYRIYKVKDLWTFHKIGPGVQDQGPNYLSLEDAVQGIADYESPCDYVTSPPPMCDDFDWERVVMDILTYIRQRLRG